MSLKYSHIKCSKCGHELGTSEQACPKCGGPVQKVCGSCGFLNSVDKKYCDSCGTMLEFRPSAGPSISVRTVVFESIGDTVNSSSFTLPKVEPKPGPGPRPDQPPSGPDSPEEGKAPSLGPRPSGPDDKSAAPPRVSGRSQKPPPAAKRSAKKLSIFSPKMLVFYLLLAVALAGLTSLFLAPHIPRIKLLLTARRYLSALSGGDYAAAYKLLSASSRESCPFEDYVRNNREYDSRVGGWEFDAPEIFMHEERAAVIKYRLKEGTGTWKDDYVSFVAENGGWALPYIWNFFGPIDEAIEKGEFAQALSLARRLAETDPVDPRTSGYLCSAQFFMKRYEQAAVSCARTVEASRFYPVGFSSDEIFWYMFYHADSLRFLGRFREALDIYGALLVKKELTPKEQCPLHMGRADAFVRLGDYAAGKDSAETAQLYCIGGIDAVEAEKRLRFITGKALDEAVAYLKNSRPRDGGPTLEQARAAELSLMRARGIRALPRDTWLAEHAGGPEYRVMMREELPAGRGRRPQIKNLHVFKVNLWTGAVAAEQPPPMETK